MFSVDNKRIFLIGAMGAGKTTVGAQLAALLRLDFFDADHLLQAEYGQSIAQLINSQGEKQFRSYEQLILAKIARQSNIVFATGGGCILDSANRTILQSSGLVCYLKVNVKQQLARLNIDANRPLLPTDPSKRSEFLHNMQLQRGYLYESIADIILPTDNMSAEEVAQRLVGELRCVKAQYIDQICFNS